MWLQLLHLRLSVHTQGESKKKTTHTQKKPSGTYRTDTELKITKINFILRIWPIAHVTMLWNTTQRPQNSVHFCNLVFSKKVQKWPQGSAIWENYSHVMPTDVTLKQNSTHWCSTDQMTSKRHLCSLFHDKTILLEPVLDISNQLQPES